jgi:hypothetical protein
MGLRLSRACAFAGGGRPRGGLAGLGSWGRPKGGLERGREAEPADELAGRPAPLAYPALDRLRVRLELEGEALSLAISHLNLAIIHESDSAC